jgi:iron complex transport system substrate-binding protein
VIELFLRTFKKVATLGVDMQRVPALFGAIVLCLIAGQAGAVISVRDDAGNTVTLQQPARRVISLAPHVTELLFAAGGGDRIVGAVNFSDYPEAAKRIPQVGDNRQIDMERVIALKPDLLVVWLHGSSARQLEQLGKLGIPLFYSEPHKLDGIARCEVGAAAEDAANIIIVSSG